MALLQDRSFNKLFPTTKENFRNKINLLRELKVHWKLWKNSTSRYLKTNSS